MWRLISEVVQSYQAKQNVYKAEVDCLVLEILGAAKAIGDADDAVSKMS